MLGPTLRTERLVLRAPNATDAALRASYLNDLDLSRYARLPSHGGRTPKQVEADFAKVADDKNAYWWAIDHEGGAVGGVILTQINWAARHGYHGYYLVDRAHWGKGIATEASRAIVTFAFTALGLEKVKAEVVAIHGPSRRVLEKVGFRQNGLFHQEFYVDGKAEDIAWYELHRADWRSMRS